MRTPHVPVIVLIFCASHAQSFAPDKNGVTFRHSSIFNVTERLKLNCSQAVPGIRSLTDCCTRCMEFQPCSGISLDSNGVCFIHNDCPYLLECRGEDKTHYYLQRDCFNDGWVTSYLPSDCHVGVNWTGCSVHPPGCLRLRKEYNLVIDPDQRGETLIPVTCIGYSPSVVLFRSQGLMNFNRTWEEYKRGFYLDEFNQWLGLDAWHRLNNAGCNQLKLRLVIQKLGQKYPMTFRRYHNLVLSGDKDNFRFEFSRTGKTSRNMPENYQLANCLLDHESTQFSTWDRDNDGDAGENCAARAGSGWWFSQGCDRVCNVFGLWPEHWKNTPSEQRLYLEGADLGSILHEDSFFEMVVEKCFD